ncbi:MAG TPA: cellulase family glycosylhydrolase [Candidatus Eisenbacteria bacterium]|nr:cellulase family glycosylhydrolase [Candidatus Eisenbacteria bacterium]
MAKRPSRSRAAVVGLLTIVALLVALAYAPVGPLTVSVPPATLSGGEPGLPWLHVSDGRVQDALGRTVLLRGFNVGALVAYPAHPPAPLDEQDASLMQQAGFDVVRLGIDWSQLEPTRGQIDRQYLDHIAAATAMLNQHGLYVVLDMHFRLGWSPAFGYSGAPGWATLPLVPNVNPLPQFSWGPALSPAAWSAETYFWLASDWQAELARAWRAVATRFRDTSGVAGYDLFNEPHPLPIPPQIFEKYSMWPFYQRMIEAVGAIDPNHLFFLEGILLFTLNTAVRPIQARNLVYADHVYEGSLVPPFWTGDPGPLADRFAQRVREAQALSAPWWVGEFGHDLTQPGAVGYADAALNNADDLHIGWAWWQWRENRYWGIRDASGERVNLEFLRHLARPYLVAAPRGVTAGRGDGIRGRLTLTVDAGHAHDPIVIGWSSLTLAAPLVSADCVVSRAWDPSTARLTIMVKPDTACRLEVFG